MGIETQLLNELLRAVRGEPLESEAWRAGFGQIPPFSGGGSHNHPSLANAVGAVLGHDRARDVWEATAMSYARHSLFGNEAGSRNAYGQWNLMALLVAWHYLDHPESLREHIRSAWTILATTASPVPIEGWGGPIKGWGGYPTTLGMARSWVQAPPRDETAPWRHRENNQLDRMLLWALGGDRMGVGWWQDIASELVGFDRAAIWESEQQTLLDVLHRAIPPPLEWLPRFPQPVKTIRWDRGDVLTFASRSWNTGSTSFCYAIHYDALKRSLSFLGTDNGKRSRPNTRIGSCALRPSDLGVVSLVAWPDEDPNERHVLEFDEIGDRLWTLTYTPVVGWSIESDLEPPSPTPEPPEDPIGTPGNWTIVRLRQARNRCEQIASGNPPEDARRRLAREARDLIGESIDDLT